MAERTHYLLPQLKPRRNMFSGFEHLFTDSVATDQPAPSRRVGVLTVQWDRKTQPSRYTQERAFRILARHAGILQRDIGPAWAVFLTPTYDEKQEGEE